MWAIGCILFEMCTLKKPFDAKNIVLLFDQITNQEPNFFNFPYGGNLLKLTKDLLNKKEV